MLCAETTADSSVQDQCYNYEQVSEFHLMYCVDLNSFNESQVNEWHDDVEQLSLAVRTHSDRIKLLVTISHRPVGSRHNKSTSLLRLSGQMEQLPASAGLLCLFFPDWFRTANLLMEFFVLLHHWREVNYLCDVCAHASERETIFPPCLSSSVWELWPKWA